MHHGIKNFHLHQFYQEVNQILSIIFLKVKKILLVKMLFFEQLNSPISDKIGIFYISLVYIVSKGLSKLAVQNGKPPTEPEHQCKFNLSLRLRQFTLKQLT